MKLLARQDEATLQDIQIALGEAMAEAGPQAVAALCVRLADAGTEWRHHPPDPLARRIHEVVADRLLAPESRLTGVEHVHAVDGRRVVICANHLSYSDANLLQILLHRGGGEALADRLAVMAGPKVYSNLKRRFSSLCFGTIKTPQSSGLSSEEAVMSTREVAREAKRAIELAHERLRLGEALLVFGEGTRSRTAEMNRMLPGVARYLEIEDAWMLPAGITGTERLFPIAEETINPVRVTVAAGPAVSVERLRKAAEGDRRVIMDAVGLAIARLLPPEYRGAYRDEDALDSARRALEAAAD